MKISVIHPTIRPDKALEYFAAWRSRSTCPSGTWEYIIVCGKTGPLVNLGEDYTVLVADADGCVQALNYGARAAIGDILVMAADDLLPPQGWDTAIIDRMGDTATAKVLAVSDGLRRDMQLTHPIITRKRFDDVGRCMFDDAYVPASGIYSDAEYTERAYRDGVVIEARDLVFKHQHPMFTAGGKPDDAIMEHNSRHNYVTGKEIFQARNPHAGFGKIAYGIRIGRTVDPSFFWCWSRLLLSQSKRPDDCVLNFAVDMPHAPAMNVLLHWFLRSDADSLLVMDDDMEFTPDVVDRLRDTPGADIVCPVMCCRRGSHGHLVLGPWDEQKQQPSRVPDNQVKGIVPVHYVGFGFTLIKRWVLEELAKKATAETRAPFMFNPTKAEDGQFSDDARSVGAKLAVNANVRVGHRFTAAVYWNNQDACVDFSENDYGVSLFGVPQKKE